MKILLIEDDYLLRTALGALLLEWGYGVSSAKNGEEAVHMMQESNAVDVLICDIFMPELSGPGMLLKFKKLFPAKFPKVILMSAVKNPEKFLQTLDMRYDAYLPKPLDFIKLQTVLQQLHH